MYEEHFGLKRPPFKITPDTSLFYDGGKRGDILGGLVYAVYRGEGIVKVVGEVGSGKTMLCRMLQLKLPKAVEIIYIANPSVSAEDILFVIAHELGLSVNKNASKHEVMHLLQDYLLQRHMEDKQVVLFVEEAQGMPLDTLEEIRLLSNLETDQNKLLQIILFGQPELDENLSIKSIRQLRERITHSFNLAPLTSAEIYKYLNFRMREVGYSGPELIDVKLAKKIALYSGGLLRKINIIADKILLSAYSEGTHSLTGKHVMAAVNDSQFGKAIDKSPNLNRWALLITLLVVLGGSLYATQLLWMPVVVDASVAGTTETVRNENAVPEQPPIPTASAAVEVEAALSVVEIVEVEVASLRIFPNLSHENNRWLNDKLSQSREWLLAANRDAVSIQVMMRQSSATRELVAHLRNNWPLDLGQTYLYEIKTAAGAESIFRVFYREFNTLSSGRLELERLPNSIKVNGPYLQSVYRMRHALL